MTQEDILGVTQTLTDKNGSGFKTSIASTQSLETSYDSMRENEVPQIELGRLDAKSPPKTSDNDRLQTAISQQFFVIADQNNGADHGDTES